MDESAVHHLGNALMIIKLLKGELPPNTQAVTVSVGELDALEARITKARDIIAAPTTHKE